jgi:cell division protein FtsZ
MVFITAGMGGGTGTGAAPVVARVAREMGILTVGVVTKPFQFEGLRRMRICDAGIGELQKHVDTLIVIPNQNLFRIANEKTTFAEAFAMADQVLYSGVASITDLMVKPGLINLDFADVRAVMREMGKAMMGTGEATGERRAIQAAEAAISNPLLDEVSMRGAKGLLISITGGCDMMLYELDEAATRIREEVDPEANIILGATQDENLQGIIRVSVVATGIDRVPIEDMSPTIVTEQQRILEAAQRLRAQAQARPVEPVMPLISRAPEIVTEPAPAPVHAPEPAVVHAPAAAADAYAEPAYDAVIPTHQPPAVQAARMPFTPLPFEEPETAYRDQQAPLAQDERQLRPVRMPRIDDLPVPAQNQLRAQQAEQDAAQVAPLEQKRMTLLQRLAAVGLGRRDEHDEVPVNAPQQPTPTQAEYARRAAPPRAAAGQLDSQGRARPQIRGFEEDQLEIPAFLRRQAN